jgi:uncharacterized protein YfkK (UPF0435 family)
VNNGWLKKNKNKKKMKYDLTQIFSFKKKNLFF